MAELSDNVYNQPTARDDAKFKLWRNVGLLLTYKCNAACEFCYYGCSPTQGGLMDIEIAIECWKSVRELAGDAGKVHITGGEPFLYFDRLIEILEAGKKEGLGPCDLVETNGGWVKDEKDTERKLKLLHELGVERFKVSCDPFHQEYVDIEQVRLVVDVAEKVFGPDKTLIRWRKYLDEPAEMRGISKQEKDKRYVEALADYSCRFTGRAAGRLAELLANKSIDEISKQNCSGAFLGSKGVHVDPYGNVFSGTCGGIIVGNVTRMSLADMWRQWTPGCNELVETLFKSGPGGLLDKAVRSGYQPLEGYAGKCHLCTSIRKFFLNKGIWSESVGPAECY